MNLLTIIPHNRITLVNKLMLVFLVATSGTLVFAESISLIPDDSIETQSNSSEISTEGELGELAKTLLGTNSTEEDSTGISDSSFSLFDLKPESLRVDIDKINNNGLPSFFTHFKGETKDGELVDFTSTCEFFLSFKLGLGNGSIIKSPKNITLSSQQILFSSDCNTAFLFPSAQSLLVLNGRQQFGSAMENQCEQMESQQENVQDLDERLSKVAIAIDDESINSDGSTVISQSTGSEYSSDRERHLTENVLPRIIQRQDDEKLELYQMRNSRAASFGLTTVSNFNSNMINAYIAENGELLSKVKSFQFRLAHIERGTMFVTDESNSSSQNQNLFENLDVIGTLVPGYIDGIDPRSCDEGDEECIAYSSNHTNQSQRIAESLSGTHPIRLILTRFWVCSNFYDQNSGMRNLTNEQYRSAISSQTSVTWSYGASVNNEIEITAKIDLRSAISSMIRKLQEYQKDWTDKLVYLNKSDLSLSGSIEFETNVPFRGMGSQSTSEFSANLKRYEDQVMSYFNEQLVLKMEELGLVSVGSDATNVGTAEDLKGGTRYRTETRIECKRKWYGSKRCWPVKINIPYTGETHFEFTQEIEGELDIDFKVSLKRDDVITYGQNATFNDADSIKQQINDLNEIEDSSNDSGEES